ncbi:bifunctional adenosylcobinamide kinase/adenosylcobinamide-phosphate guanylyltransferase [Agarivorans sp. 1_MG-2023]|uniref:bifunctional adenosylcobinamide kinase/adenosylcobinamide-phosphate guanylyltransferase n=1 Tax=Agarivorans sp. 1_MG-2023 TaxID=3062634 RepID=UPI0026E359DA|nr:bifunctional adenosylcobinamide kinase/adenosylcobinamide-phosphate guanylyltransferase [Agarivorans sp. 1_MG-2023]MDO6762726.1 bifunctional adenosylcobinamide kinase/adenosylcobinamide-phosphate guanylyltransferase [Agarivorans sp. 1_MG-2023]
MISLVLGGIRSGKSSWAEKQFSSLNNSKPVYIATAMASDTEMAQRIQHHQSLRKAAFDTHELDFSSENLSDVLSQYAMQNTPVLLECMSTWLGWWLCTDKSPNDQLQEIKLQTSMLLACLEQFSSDLVIVSNEVGLGLVSDNPMARMFADELGRLNQALAAKAHKVVLISAGLPLILKDTQA